MVVSTETFWLQKAGNEPREYEDAFWPQITKISEAGKEFNFAIADGATDACFSGAWAGQLVEAFCEGMLDTSKVENGLLALRQRWREHIASKGPLPWYVEQKADSGAFATLLGLTLKDSADREGGGMWKALAIGDSCLFHLRGRQVLRSFPIEEEQLFNNSPILLSSKSGEDDVVLGSARSMGGEWLGGDTFYLMTDALACWFLGQLKDGKIPWNRLETVGEKDKRFESWINRLRARKLIRNDDVTLCRIELHRPYDF